MIASFVMHSWIGACLMVPSPEIISCHVAEPPGTTEDPRVFLDEVIAAYRDLDSYADEGLFTVEVVRGADRQVQDWPCRFVLQRPKSLAIEAGTARLVIDGMTILTVLVPTKSYLLEPAPERLTPAIVSEGSVGALLLGGPGGVPATILLQLLLGDDPASSILAGGARLAMAPDTEMDGIAMRTIRLDTGAGPDYLLHIDPRTKLVQSVTVDVEAAAPAEGDSPERNTSTIKMRWSSGTIRTGSIDGEVFSVKPPGDYREIPLLSRNAPE